MSARNDGGPAFPLPKESAQRVAAATEDLNNPRLDPAERAYEDAMRKMLPGMTLRDYFAAKAMQVFVLQWETEDYASIAYAVADAMLAERAK